MHAVHLQIETGSPKGQVHMQQTHFKSVQTLKSQLVRIQDWPGAVCAGQKSSASPLERDSGSLLTAFLSTLAVPPAGVSFRIFYKPNRCRHVT